VPTAVTAKRRGHPSPPAIRSIMVTMKPLAICLLLLTSLALAESHEDLIDRAFESVDDEKELASIVNRESVVLLDETDSFWLFGFRPTVDSEDEQVFMKSVEGTLKINKEGHYVAVITLQNKNTIKPGKGVKIKTFFTRLEFAPIQEGGPALPRSVQATVKGKAFLVIKFDETETVTYSDFEQAYD
jgi:hypothetical protein